MLYFFLFLQTKKSELTERGITYKDKDELVYLSLNHYTHYWNIVEPHDLYDQNDLCLCCQEISWMDETR